MVNLVRNRFKEKKRDLDSETNKICRPTYSIKTLTRASQHIHHYQLFRFDNVNVKATSTWQKVQRKQYFSQIGVFLEIQKTNLYMQIMYGLRSFILHFSGR